MEVGQRIGPFEIEDELGSGAMGTVYRAKFHKDGDRVIPVALKVVAMGLLGNESAMARFDREANILKQLRHRHIVRLIGFGRYKKQTPFIAMEYVDGEALDRVLSRRGRISWEDVVSHARQLCEALSHAHEHGIIHRDLKPSNLMITRDNILKLTDFGIAKDTDVTALTGAHNTIGTASYMSPEQCKGDKSLTPKSDLYSLGVVLFELITGKKPFVAENTVELFLMHVNDRPPRPGKLIPELPAKLEALILQLMAKDKDERPTDAAWVGRMLAEIEEDAFARRSAGLDAATARKTDRRRESDSPVDALDREAVRALKGGKKKRKHPKKALPLWQRRWVKATGIVLAMLGIVLGAYLALRPPSADKLFAAIEAAPQLDGKTEAAEHYLKIHGQTPSEQTDKAAEVFRNGKVALRERQLANRFNHGLNKPSEAEDAQAYTIAWQAMQTEKDGNLKQAADLWTRAKNRFPEEGKLPFSLADDVLAKAEWTWVADKRLQDIREVDVELAKLRAKIVDNRRYELPTIFDSTNPESLAIKGLRLEDFGDFDKATRGCWNEIINLTEKEPKQRVWYLLACQQRAARAKETPEAAYAKRKVRMERELTEAEQLCEKVKGDPQKKADRANVRTKCREIVELYDDDMNKETAALVARAKKVMGEVPKG